MASASVVGTTAPHPLGTETVHPDVLVDLISGRRRSHVTPKSVHGTRVYAQELPVPEIEFSAALTEMAVQDLLSSSACPEDKAASLWFLTDNACSLFPQMCRVAHVDPESARERIFARVESETGLSREALREQVMDRSVVCERTRCDQRRECSRVWCPRKQGRGAS